MKKPEEKEYRIKAVDGKELISYVVDKLIQERGWVVDEYNIYGYIVNHQFGEDVEVSQLFELIIEEEDYCNGDNPDDIKDGVLQTIAEEFGGHFNINFLDMTAYL